MNIYLYTNVLCHQCATVPQAAHLQILDDLVNVQIITLDNLYISVALTWLSIFFLIAVFSHHLSGQENNYFWMEIKKLQLNICNEDHAFQRIVIRLAIQVDLLVCSLFAIKLVLPLSNPHRWIFSSLVYPQPFPFLFSAIGMIMG